MLLKFSVKNFRGFVDKIELDLSNPKEYEFNKYAIKDGIIKNGIIYGPNGSGKTNLGYAIFDIVNHLTQKYSDNEYYKNFIFAGNSFGSVNFEYAFKFNDRLVNYCYSKNERGFLLTERLLVNNEEIFYRGEKDLIICDEYNIEESIKKSFSDSVNNASILNFIYTVYPLKEDHYISKLLKFVNSMLLFRNVDRRSFIGLDTNRTILGEYIITNNLVKEFSSFLKSVSNQDINFIEHNKNDTVLLCQVGDNTIPFDLYASTGTMALELLFYWMHRMKDTSFVFIDEFDAFFHFKLAFEVCKSLFQLDCQVFLSSHNTFLMTNDLLRPDCNFIIDKNEINSLCDCTEKELRFGHNIEKLFRGGTFNL